VKGDTLDIHNSEQLSLDFFGWDLNKEEMETHSDKERLTFEDDELSGLKEELRSYLIGTEKENISAWSGSTD
jgi:hypothetical protein